MSHYKSINNDSEYQASLSSYAKLLEDQANDNLSTEKIVELQSLESALNAYERVKYSLGE